MIKGSSDGKEFSYHEK